MMDKEVRFRAVVDCNKDRIYRLCCCYVVGDEARKDVYQDVLMHLWHGLESFEGRSQLSTWVYRVTVNSCLSYLRAEKRRKRFLEVDEKVDINEIQDDCGVPAAMEDDIGYLYRCIAQLDPVDRALVLLYLEEANTREMAEILGISEANVRVKLHRVKKTLKEIWERTDRGLE